MSSLVAYTAALSDDGLARAVESFAVLAQKTTTTLWCFVEGPTVCDFVPPDRAVTLVPRLWLVRLFDAERELTARRLGFDADQPWRARVIGQQRLDEEATHGKASGAAAGGGSAHRAAWAPHALERGEERVLMLYGKGKNDDAFHEDSRFRDAFSYPGVPVIPGASACIVMSVHGVPGGQAVVRWVRLCAGPELEGR